MSQQFILSCLAIALMIWSRVGSLKAKRTLGKVIWLFAGCNGMRMSNNSPGVGLFPLFAYMRTNCADPAFGGAATVAALWRALVVRLRMTQQPAATGASAFAQPAARHVGRDRVSPYHRSPMCDRPTGEKTVAFMIDGREVERTRTWESKCLAL